LAETQCRAARDDKTVQLELAKAYEDGSGVTQDLKRAAELYRAAAAFQSGTTYVYSPGVGNARGGVIPIRIGSDQPGLPEAKYRLGMMYRMGRGVERDEKKAASLIEQSLKDGYVPR
jgi:TPR repeat protein